MKTEKNKNSNPKTLILFSVITIILGVAFVFKTTKEKEKVMENLNVLAFNNFEDEKSKKFDYELFIKEGIITDSISKAKFNKHRKNVMRKISNLELERKNKKEIELKKLNKRLNELKKVLKYLDTLELSPCRFKLKVLDSKIHPMANITYDTTYNAISINYFKNNTASFVHEATHAYQFTKGDIAFAQKTKTKYDDEINKELPLAVDLFDEVSAYRAQYAYDPVTVKSLSSSHKINVLEDINAVWVRNIRNNHPNVKEEDVYLYKRPHVALDTVNIYTSVHELCDLYIDNKWFCRLHGPLVLKDYGIISYLDCNK
ncbi:hypothetical protein Q4Q35_12870 [Flavivirga aquimarina]|uniref:Uncharacterized protein n=1 Tax=Flavivirga aquimarina TaxID=2027862 RepID=A0ABT8WCC2_9FLAO|nr:hypothetical protein [Flavivirga aquimarina]MDO5970703.1 hypothetical protein [Flavivirga aquimarina]